jgi:hypothetical protein
MEHTDANRISALFAKRQPTYSRTDAASLVNMSEEDLAMAIANGVVRVEQDERGADVVPWEDLAVLTLEEWTPRMIAAVLRDDPDSLPLLNQQRLIRVSLPIYLIRLLDHVARRESAAHRVPRNASDIIERVLHDFANICEDVNIPGFAEALDYPYFTPRRTGLLWLRCRYCGISITEPVREVCRPCESRHEPNEHLGEYGLDALEPAPRRIARQRGRATRPRGVRRKAQ